MSGETVKVSTTMRPTEEIEVGKAEFTDLARQGVIAKVNGRKFTTKDQEAAENGGNGN